ncbi:MAG: 5-formyltetrahydrofolate cyclo-ligase [Roseivirga sp.]|nr:5-formyltetrahydrofolate cyclo-ligase [Roseivirga sp.]
MNKEAIRKRFLKERKELSDTEYQQRCTLVSDQAIDLIKGTISQKTHLFLPIIKNKEVNTWPIYHWLIDSPQHTPVISKTHFKKNILSHHSMTREDDIQESNYGIPEPLHSITVDPEQLDLVFVPLLAFDTFGNRVGYGAGFYDRFLAQCQKDTLKVGLAISPPIEETIETNDFDVPLDLCITHKGLYDFRI